MGRVRTASPYDVRPGVGLLRLLHQLGVSYRKLALVYGVDRKTIRKIVQGLKVDKKVYRKVQRVGLDKLEARLRLTLAQVGVDKLLAIGVRADDLAEVLGVKRQQVERRRLPVEKLERLTVIELFRALRAIQEERRREDLERLRKKLGRVERINPDWVQLLRHLLSRKDLAKILGVSEAIIKKIEQGKPIKAEIVEWIGRMTVLDLLKALGIVEQGKERQAQGAIDFAKGKGELARFVERLLDVFMAGEDEWEDFRRQYEAELAMLTRR